MTVWCIIHNVSDLSNTPTSAFERLVRSRWYGAGGIQGLSKVSGVSRATMYSWFRSETMPDAKSLARLAGVLDLSVAELVEAIGGEGDVPSSPNVPSQSLLAPAARVGDSQSFVRRALPSDGPMIGDALPPQQVTWCSADDPIGPVARSLYEHHFSQAPVRDGGQWIGLLTTEAIARWMAGRSRNELDVEARAPVREVLAYADDAGDFRVVPPDVPASEVIALFDGAALRGQPLKAVLIANSRADGSPRGIVTVSDLPHLRRMASHIPTPNLSRTTKRLTREPNERGQNP